MKRNEDIARAVEAGRAQILAFLTEMVNVNSYVHDHGGVERVAAVIAREMPACFEHEVIENERFAAHRRFSHVTGASLPVLLVGHMDTLCPPRSSFQRLTDKGDTLVGPGVNDMKGGLAVIVWALRILEQCGLLTPLSLVCVFNADEEVGSPTSTPLFTGMQGRASKALVFECGGPEGTVVTTRKGCSRYRLAVTGRAAHFGNLKGSKTSAILELAYKTLAIESLNRADGSVVANVGKVRGGLAANAVAEAAFMEFETRYWTAQAQAEAEKAIQDITSCAAVSGCRLSLSPLSHRPPLQPSAASRELLAAVRAVAASLGRNVIEEKRGGLSDANWLSHVGIPTIDGLGPLGDGDFTEHEYILKETLFHRIELLAHLLLNLRPESS